MVRVMSAKARNTAGTFGRSLANALFIDMLDPAARGDEFTWEGFPSFAERHVRAHVFMYYQASTWNLHSSEIKRVAGLAARDQAEYCLSKSKIQEWHPLPPKKLAEPAGSEEKA